MEPNEGKSSFESWEYVTSTSEELGSKNPTGMNVNHKYDCYIYFLRKQKKSCETPENMLERKHKEQVTFWKRGRKDCFLCVGQTPK